MIDRDDPANISSEDRLREVASLLASGIMRLQRREALPGKEVSKSVPELSADGLEVPAETRLSVRVG